MKRKYDDPEERRKRQVEQKERREGR